MRSIIRADYDSALKSVTELRHTQAGLAWESLIDARIESLKEELVTAKAERVPELQGAIREMRRLVETIRKLGG